MQTASQKNHHVQAPAETTAAVLASECGDVLGEMFHPAFKELAYWRKNNVFAFTPSAAETGGALMEQSSVTQSMGSGNTGVSWPDMFFGPVNLWSLPSAYFFYLSQQEKEDLATVTCQ